MSDNNYETELKFLSWVYYWEIEVKYEDKQTWEEKKFIAKQVTLDVEKLIEGLKEYPHKKIYLDVKYSKAKESHFLAVSDYTFKREDNDSETKTETKEEIPAVNYENDVKAEDLPF